MKKIKHIGIYFIVCLLFFAACKEDSGTIGLGIQPEDEFLNTDFLDSTTIVAYSALHDSLITSNVSVNMLGYLNDPIFGKTQAGIYTQFCLSSFNVDFGENAVADSVILTLVYAGYYGDTLNSFKLNVYELEEKISRDKIYYTTSSVRNKGESLTENPNLHISPRPTTRPDSVSSAYYVSVKLKKDFADKLISLRKDAYVSDDAFLEHFKGLYLEASDLTGSGCMLSINMTHAMSKLTIYYSNSDMENNDYSFVMNESTAHFGVFNHFGYADAISGIREQLSGNQTSTNETLYVQAGAGVKIALHFPHLKELFENKKVIIHRAALVISQRDDALANYPPSSALHITYKMNDTTTYLLPDYFLGSDYFGGKYIPEKKEYSFNITQYIQNLVDGRGDNYLLNLYANPSVTHFSRLMIYGTKPAEIDKRLKLKINYTVIN